MLEFNSLITEILLNLSNMQELMQKNHSLHILILSWYLNTYVTERISERIEYLFQL